MKGAGGLSPFEGGYPCRHLCTFDVVLQEFLETICILDGQAQHLPWHQARVDNTLRVCMRDKIPFTIERVLEGHAIPDAGKIKCTIRYGPDDLSVSWVLHKCKPVTALKLIEIPKGYDYRFKYADRKVIEDLFSQRGDADDILMTRGGWITDTSVANIAFRKMDRWYTPAQPLLAGTTWKRLIKEGKLIPRPIHQLEFDSFDEFKVISALQEF